MLIFQNSGLMDRLFFLYSQPRNISFSWTTYHRTQWLCTSNYWSWRFSFRKMKRGYRCHLSLKGPLPATVPKCKGFPPCGDVKGKWESLLGLGTSSHLWGQLPHSCFSCSLTRLVPVLSPGKPLTAIANNRSQQDHVRTGVGASRGSLPAEKGPPQRSPGTPHCGGALLPPATAGSCFFLHNRCLERLVTMHYGF